MWMYGVTAVLERRDNLLLSTLSSLRNAGFPDPRVFVDGDSDPLAWERVLKAHGHSCDITARWPRVLTAGNWILSLAELYLREPCASRYAIFQDDIVLSRNVRQYLDKQRMDGKVYWNLYTFPENQKLAKYAGFFPSNQCGKGALALVFDRQGTIELLTRSYMLDRAADAKRGWQAVDGGIITCLTNAGYKEMCCNPSLVQHMGDRSTMGHGRFPQSPSFQGEQFDCLTL
jgi:hypothetical protein